jgi:hydroxyacylglutathione hydrolase/adenylyltransferase/sulfurtransferase
MSHNPLVNPELEITPERTKELLDTGEVVVIDVREPYERDAGHIDGSEHIELERLASKAESLPRDKQIVFQCRLGARSAMAAQAFRASGYDAWSMAGGLQSWADKGLPVGGGGEVADH